MPDSSPHISLIREALERDCWRMRDGKRDFSIRDDALIALRDLEEQLEATRIALRRLVEHVGAEENIQVLTYDAWRDASNLLAGSNPASEPRDV